MKTSIYTCTTLLLSRTCEQNHKTHWISIYIQDPPRNYQECKWPLVQTSNPTNSQPLMIFQSSWAPIGNFFSVVKVPYTLSQVDHFTDPVRNCWRQTNQTMKAQVMDRVPPIGFPFPLTDFAICVFIPLPYCTAKIPATSSYNTYVPWTLHDMCPSPVPLPLLPSAQGQP